MINNVVIEKLIEDELKKESDYILFDELLEKIAKDNGIKIKKIKSVLYQNNSKYYETSGYIDGKRVSIQNFILSSKKIFRKIFHQIETNMNCKLSFSEKIKIIMYMEFIMREGKT